MNKRRKILMVILDGLGDLPNAALDGQTPLEAAATPVLDELAAQGICALVDPAGPGIIVETHAGIAPLMGLDGSPDALERGPIEAAGVGVELAPGDVALRGNFATVAGDGPTFDILDRRAGRINQETEALVASLNEIGPINGVDVFVAAQQQHRIVVRLSGTGLSAQITDTDPGTEGVPQRVRSSAAQTPNDAAAIRTAAILNEFLPRAHAVLDAHPINKQRAARGEPVANGVITRGAGSGAVAKEGLIGRLGLRGAVVSGDRTSLGLARLLGFTPICEPGFSGLIDSDPVAKVAAALAALATHDIAWIHIKGTDIASHDKQPLQKRDCIERVDAALRPLLDKDIIICITADHTTDSNTGSHTADPVPSLLRVPGGPRDAVTSFGETACRDGGLGRLRSAAYLCQVLNAAGITRQVLDAAS